MYYVLSIAITVLILTGCSGNTAEAPKNAQHAHVTGDSVKLTQQQRASARIRSEVPVERSLSTGLRVQGMLHVPPQYAVSITAPLGGIVRSTSVLPGSYVRKGTTLAVLEHPDFITLQQDYLTTTSSLELADLEYKRQERLAQDNVNARKAFEQAAAELRSLRVKAKALQEKLSLIGINVRTLDEKTLSRSVPVIAPIDGYVTRVHVNTGSYIAPNDPLLAIVNPDHMHIELTIFEKDVMNIKVGQTMTVTLADDPSATRKGHVHLIGKEIEADRTVVVHGHFDEADPSLIPGTSLTAIVDTDPRTGLVVPDAAIVRYEGQIYVFVDTENDGLYVRRRVETGPSAGGFTEITGATTTDLKSAKIVTNGASALLGAMVNTEEE